ncbi:hypothetical protein [Marinifilum sp. D714]|uniref:hypothetical protein n=1 Tax=Marinifilum sp. D714 TaxID=2937523 RepID=UPI0027C1F76C|nr:hypothetical protein [Marinifilum sp. D714]MDQ2180849.1 hypothetical protein [Marinifilum sp. D714]
MNELIFGIILLIAGLILTTIGGFKANDGWNKLKGISQTNGEETIIAKLDSIPKSINTKNKENTDKVLDAIEEVKLGVDEISAMDGSNIKTIKYPPSGEFGTNILDKTKGEYKIGTHSMRVEIPKGQTIVVKVSGKNWQFPVFQSIPGWKHFDLKTDKGETSRKFKSVKTGIVDLEIYLVDKGKIDLSIFENGSELPSWEKTLKVN